MPLGDWFIFFKKKWMVYQTTTWGTGQIPKLSSKPINPFLYSPSAKWLAILTSFLGGTPFSLCQITPFYLVVQKQDIELHQEYWPYKRKKTPKEQEQPKTNLRHKKDKTKWSREKKKENKQKNNAKEEEQRHVAWQVNKWWYVNWSWQLNKKKHKNDFEMISWCFFHKTFLSIKQQDVLSLKSPPGPRYSQRPKRGINYCQLNGP